MKHSEFWINYGKKWNKQLIKTLKEGDFNKAYTDIGAIRGMLELIKEEIMAYLKMEKRLRKK